MYIGKYLNFNFHIQQLIKNLSRINGSLSKRHHNAPIETCLQVYYAIFYAYLTYGCCNWRLTSEENLNKIEVLQKKCVRIITSSDFNSHTSPLFIELRLLKNYHFLRLQ